MGSERRVTLRQVWDAARAAHRRTGHAVSVHLEFRVSDDGEYCAVTVHGGGRGCEIGLTLGQAAEWFEAIGQPDDPNGVAACVGAVP